MELKVWVDGFQRIVCGVTDNTTCQDVVYALAHATGKVGRFTLIERWRCNERHLAPQENPLKILMKWGEYSSDVQFILQRSDGPKQAQSPQQIQRQQQRAQHAVSNNNNRIPEPNINEVSDINIDRHKHVRKSFTFGHLVSDVRLADKVGIVRGVPQIKSDDAESRGQNIMSDQTAGLINAGVQETDENFMAHIKILDNHRKDGLAYRDTSVSLVPPPYRDPPPPTNQIKIPLTSPESPSKKQTMQQDYSLVNGLSEINESLLYNIQYRDLISLVKCQQDKLNSQQSDLNKYDADIEYLECKTREQQEQLDVLSQEIMQADIAIRQGSEQLQALSYVEEENEIIKQQEKTLKSELTLLRSKLANCETELLQCKNKIRLLLDELQLEQKAHIRQYDNRQQLELCLLNEVEHLQLDIEHAKVNTEDATQTADVLKMEVSELEAAITEKKRQVERLVSEMKEVNLQSLTNSTIAEEVKFLLEGSHKPGSTRRMIGSPRQLENAVPTNKNPHGVWV